MKKIAIAFLAAAIAAIASSFWFSQHGNEIQGPSALAVLDDKSVWLSVDEELWQLSSEGHLLSKTNSQKLGMSGRVDNIVVHPSGQLVLNIRDQEALRFFDPNSGKIQGSLVPQWPASLREHSSRSINFAFSANGLLAIATGGGHAVALFDETGHFLRRTAPDFYRFTNGLWWQADVLWTTNTNKFELIALSALSMEAEKTVKLDSAAHARFLGMATPSRNQTGPSPSTEKPFATVARFANNMIEGRIVDVFADGDEREFRSDGLLEPRAVAWHGDKLLAVDGKSFSVKQFSSDRTLLADFGDASVRAELNALLRAKHYFELIYRLVLFLGITLFVVGFALAAVVSQREKAALQIRVIQPKLLGMAVPGVFDRWRITLLFGPVLILMLLSFSVRAFWVQMVLLGAGLVYFRAALAWASVRSEWEAIVNMQALRSLSKPEIARLLESGETVRETLMLLGLQSRWLVLTQRRVMVFSMNALDRSLQLSISNADIIRARLTTWRELPWTGKLRTLLLFGSARLELYCADDTLISGYVITATTAERIVSLISLHVGQQKSSMTSVKRKIAVDVQQGHANKQWRWQLLASFLVPGLGQWMQGRRGTALMFFLIFSVYVLAVTIPLIWTLYGPRSEVSSVSAGVAIVMPLLISCVAAWDSWNLRAKKTPSSL